MTNPTHGDQRIVARWIVAAPLTESDAVRYEKAGPFESVDAALTYSKTRDVFGVSRADVEMFIEYEDWWHAEWELVEEWVEGERVFASMA